MATENLTLGITTSRVKESIATKGDITATCTEWATQEGVSILLEEKRQVIAHCSLRWEELDLLNAVTATLRAN